MGIFFPQFFRGEKIQKFLKPPPRFFFLGERYTHPVKLFCCGLSQFYQQNFQQTSQVGFVIIYIKSVKTSKMETITMANPTSTSKSTSFKAADLWARSKFLAINPYGDPSSQRKSEMVKFSSSLSLRTRNGLMIPSVSFHVFLKGSSSVGRVSPEFEVSSLFNGKLDKIWAFWPKSSLFAQTTPL